MPVEGLEPKRMQVPAYSRGLVWQFTSEVQKVSSLEKSPVTVYLSAFVCKAQARERRDPSDGNQYARGFQCLLQR